MMEQGERQPGSARSLTRRHLLQLMAGGLAASLSPRTVLADSGMVTVAISADTLGGANINDARAAYRIWTQEVTRHLGAVRAVVNPQIFLPSDELLRDVRAGTVDCYGITALEYMKVADITDPNFILLQDSLADGMEYILVVNNQSSFHSIADLRGAQMIVHHHPELVLAPTWLETTLAASSLPPVDHFFGNIVSRNNINQVALPVFFRRVDAACLARHSWETAVELNPQLGRSLRVLAVSPKLVPIFVAFRRHCSDAGRSALIDAIRNITSVAAGQQIVALYQSHSFVVRTAAVLKTTVDMLTGYQRVLARLRDRREDSRTGW
ncbi:MAG: PhnD/SsuA/transferrin family substrate-binding protein [Acidobacteriota bacterium]